MVDPESQEKFFHNLIIQSQQKTSVGTIDVASSCLQMVAQITLLNTVQRLTSMLGVTKLPTAWLYSFFEVKSMENAFYQLNLAFW